MTAKLQGGLDGDGLKIGVVVARFNDFITARLLEGATSALTSNGVREDEITVAWVPGSFEIPVIARRMAESARFDAVVCLGAVIKGETDHYLHIAEQTAAGIARAGQKSGVPVIFGVLTTDTVEQAIERSGGADGEHVAEPLGMSKPEIDDAQGDGGNSGYSAGLSAIEMANLVRSLDAG